MLVDRSAYEQREFQTLASYGMKSGNSRGRKHPEKEHEFRTVYQRDRDRILYSTAFRRLQYKTQVFVNHEGDHFRTRLTHTLETSQIAGTIARALGLNEDLVQAIALGHDLGHGPFGHAGEWALSEMMKDHGGFEHNVQGLRIVEYLEEGYSCSFPGLNLSFETLEGLRKHPEQFYSTREERYRTLEADVVDLADEIAYSSHDLDDGLRSGLITIQQVETLEIWRHISASIKEPAGQGSRKDSMIRLIINTLVQDLTETTLANISRLDIKSPEDLQNRRAAVVEFSAAVKRCHTDLKRFLMKELYQHYYVLRMTHKGQRFIKALFQAYLEKPRLLPPGVQVRGEKDGLHRAVCDYLAGMTDRFAVEEYERLFQPFEKLR